LCNAGSTLQACKHSDVRLTIDHSSLTVHTDQIARCKGLHWPMHTFRGTLSPPATSIT
jgi:hypothetical protein